MKIREMSVNDLEFALNLTTLEGWNPKGSFIGEVDDEPVGMVCTVNYGEFGFISNLIVQNIYRGQNFGKILMEIAMKHLLDSGTKSILLDGVPKAVSLYERLGFRKIAKSLRLEAELTGRNTQHSRPMTERDLEEIATFDSQHFGSQRDYFLRMRFSTFQEFGRVIEVDDKIQGFIMGSRSGSSVRIGPWVMNTQDEFAEQLLLEFAGMVEGNTLKIGVLENNVQALKLLDRYDFKEKSYSWRMLYGEDTEVTLSNHLYAIFSPARG
ncbi:MAG: GNAT family N-acetyltransferase [Candidatus Thorarchaeota archaeon]